MRRVLLIVPALVAALLFACSERSPDDPGDDPGPVKRDAAFWTAEGWKRYEAADYDGARSAFNNAIDKDSTYVPAIAGRSWTNIEFGFAGLALTEFEKAISLDSSAVDCYYGAAYMAHAQGMTFPGQSRTRFEQTVGLAILGLRRGGDSYVFSHNPSINAVSLRVLQAHAYYGLGRYSEAEDVVDLLDPNNGLNSSGATYLQDLLLAIEGLQELIP
jgi:tetratricopeptide (TPR) repeat protein